MFFGLWGWLVGARGLTAWTYPNGPTVQLEMAREGIDDFKYLAMIEKYLRSGRGGPDARSAAAEFLEGLRSRLKLNEGGAFVGGWGKSWENAAESVDLNGGFKKKLFSLLGGLAGGKGGT